MNKKLLLALGFTLSTHALADFTSGIEAANKGDFKTAITEMTAAAQSGNSDAQFILGLFYFNGQGVTQDHNKAFEWYNKAATQGNIEAQSNLGYMYESGVGVTQDLNSAFTWYKKAADQGHPGAQANLGSLYENGKGVKQDYKKAIELYTKAAEKGFGEYNLGLLYATGKGVTKDYAKALDWYRKAASHGHANAQYNLGIMYYNGQGVKRNKVITYALAFIAADNNSADAVANRNSIAAELSPEDRIAGKKLQAEMQKPNNLLNALDAYVKSTVLLGPLREHK